MNTKNILNLIRLHKALMNKMFYLAPFLGMALLIVLFLTLEDDFHKVLTGVSNVSLVMTLVGSVRSSVEMYYDKFFGMDKTTLPASNQEKFVSIMCVALIESFLWIIAIIIGLAVLCIIGNAAYGMLVSQVVSLCTEPLNITNIATVMLFTTAVMLWTISGYVKKKQKYLSRIALLFMVASVFILSYISDSIPENMQDIVRVTYMIVITFVFAAWSYHNFKLTQQI